MLVRDGATRMYNNCNILVTLIEIIIVVFLNILQKLNEKSKRVFFNATSISRFIYTYFFSLIIRWF